MEFQICVMPEKFRSRCIDSLGCTSSRFQHRMLHPCLCEIEISMFHMMKQQD